MTLTPSPEPPLEELVLHVGLGKCGTTSVQRFLHRNRSQLAEQGLLVPVSPGRARHVDVGLFVRSEADLEQTVEWQRRRAASVPEFRRRVRRHLVREVRRAALPRALLTDEDLFSAKGRAVLRARRLTDRLAARTRLLVYLRRQDDHLVSRYQQTVKIGEIARLEEYAARDWAWKYDYLRQLRTWQRILEPARVVVRRYEPEGFEGGSLFQDFLGAAGVDADAARLEQVASYNESLPVEAAEFIRLHNICLVEEEGAVPYLIDNRTLIKRLREVVEPGPRLTLPSPLLDRFMDRWAKSNREVATDFLGDPELFRTPRKSAKTTTEQRIDPDRLDLLCEAVETPATRRSRLRELAAQGA